MAYIKGLKFDCFSKIDGTNSKIIYLPSTGECFCGGKTDNADIVHTGQKAMLDEIIARIKPTLAELFPKESAKFAPVMNDKNQIRYSKVDSDIHGIIATPDITPTYPGFYGVTLEEVPVYIYGEFFGKKIQDGGNYDKDKNRFAIFDVCMQGWYVPIDMLFDYAKKLDLDVAPYIGQMTIDEAEKMVMKGFKTLVPNVTNPDYMEEGIVARPVVPIKDPRGKRIIVKIKSCDYNDLKNAIAKVGEDSYKEFVAWYKENQEMIESKTKK